VPIDRSFVGRAYPASAPYEVGREHVRTFAEAIGETSSACRALGHPDVIAPPTFLTVLSFRFRAESPIADPALGLDYRLVVHGEQRFTHHRPVHAGDVLTSVSTVTEIKDAGRNELMTVTTEVSDAAGEPVATIASTLVSRGTAAVKEP